MRTEGSITVNVTYGMRWKVRVAEQGKGKTPMQQVVIENPFLNSSLAESAWHFCFSNESITNEVVEATRVSSYFIPIAKPKKKGEADQLVFDTNGLRTTLKKTYLSVHSW